MKFKHEFMNMVDLGRLFGVSSHQIGKWLKQLGLRRDDGSPSTAAYNQKLVSFNYERWGTYNAVWHVEKVTNILEEAGHQPIVDPPCDLVEPPEISGPFTIRKGKDDRWQIVGGDGEVAIFVNGETNARVIQRVLNIANKAELLNTIRAKTK